MKLTVRLPLVFIPLMAAPLLVVGALAYFQLRTYSEETSLEEVSGKLTQSASDLTRIIDDAKANAELISQDPLIQNYLLTADEEERYGVYQLPLEKKFVSIQSVFPEYVELRILLPEGFEEVRVVEPYSENVSELEGSTDYFRSMQSANADTYAGLHNNPDTEQLVLYVLKKMKLINAATDDYSTEARLRGYLGITVDLSRWLEIIQDSSWDDGGGLILAGEEGEFLALGARLQPLAEELGSLLVGESLHDPEDSWLHELKLTNKIFYHKFVDTGSGLRIHAILPEEELSSASRQVAILMSTILAIVMVIALPLLFILLKMQVITPIQRLRTALQTVGEGDMRTSLSTGANDEFSDLNNAFNQMSNELHETNERIRRLAYKDTLTGLPNRLTFLSAVEQEIALAKRTGSVFALLFLDLDNFKHVNDTLGHEYGDQLLRDVAARLSEQLREYDRFLASDPAVGETTVARLGGDEFTVLLSQLSSPMEAGIVAQRIIDILALPLELNNQAYYVSASIGVAMYPDDGNDVEELIKHADLAMYEAKKQGRNNYQYFSQAISEQSHRRAKLDQKLHNAIKNDEFELVYQPVIDCRSCRVSYYEALIRWVEPELGTVSPHDFIPLSEENGMVGLIGGWVIQESVRQLEQWQLGELPNAVISINVSGIQLSKPDFVQHLMRALGARGITPRSIIIELTEAAVITGKEDVIGTLEGLRRSGVRIALDDFGTGYSSLSYLTSLPIDIVKIDSSFVSKFRDKQSAAVIGAIITMAHALGMEVVAEGVETREHVEFLAARDCEFMQGFVFSAPQLADELVHMLPDDISRQLPVSLSTV